MPCRMPPILPAGAEASEVDTSSSLKAQAITVGVATKGAFGVLDQLAAGRVCKPLEQQARRRRNEFEHGRLDGRTGDGFDRLIGRASCRERVCESV